LQVGISAFLLLELPLSLTEQCDLVIDRYDSLYAHTAMV
jgi:hypothetical protein